MLLQLQHWKQIQIIDKKSPLQQKYFSVVEISELQTCALACVIWRQTINTARSRFSNSVSGMLGCWGHPSWTE
jgi:hypothetical protein